jgi:type II secretory pathway pseudopilin PulG
MKSFTLIEMIFVVVLIGIVSIGAINAIPDNTFTNNTKYLYNKVLEKKANAIGLMANTSDSEENRSVCIAFNKEWLKNDETYSKVKFNLSNRIKITPNKTICFDYLGRPHENDINLTDFSTILHKKVDINITYIKNNKCNTLTIYPITGYVEIHQCE